MKLKLSVRSLAHPCAEFVFDQFPLVIGRSEEANVTLDDRWASRRHCLIETHDGMLIVQDLGSKHGTLLNDAIISEAVLKPGDRLSIGLTTLTATYDVVGVDALDDAGTVRA
ncbi:MAG TPA: FHA domain-containing protein [Pirellulaceae bacterium]|nr:FHA domain-containing protein [Pirellulaceae bacterium]